MCLRGIQNRVWLLVSNLIWNVSTTLSVIRLTIHQWILRYEAFEISQIKLQIPPCHKNAANGIRGFEVFYCTFIDTVVKDVIWGACTSFLKVQRHNLLKTTTCTGKSVIQFMLCSGGSSIFAKGQIIKHFVLYTTLQVNILYYL